MPNSVSKFLKFSKYNLRATWFNLSVIFSLLAFSTFTNAQPKKTIITGFTARGETDYPVQLKLSVNPDFEPQKEFNSKTKNGFFRLDVPMNKPAYFNLTVFTGLGPIAIGDALGLSDDFSTFLYLLEPGDSIHIRFFGKDSMDFSGRGYEKCLYRQVVARKIAPVRNMTFNNPEPGVPSLFTYLDSLGAVGLSVLNSYKDKISPIAYILLKADIEGLIGYRRIKYFMFAGFKRDSVSKEIKRDSGIYNSAKKLYSETELPFLVNIFPGIDTLSMSGIYWLYLLMRTYVD